MGTFGEDEEKCGAWLIARMNSVFAGECCIPTDAR